MEIPPMTTPGTIDEKLTVISVEIGKAVTRLDGVESWMERLTDAFEKHGAQAERITVLEVTQLHQTQTIAAMSEAHRVLMTEVGELRKTLGEKLHHVDKETVVSTFFRNGIVIAVTALVTAVFTTIGKLALG